MKPTDKLNSERLKDIFLGVLERQSPAERERYLAEACQDQPELRQQLESLLQAHEQLGDFLGPAANPFAPGLIAERPGTVIDRYKLLELIGEGGFGSVWMAEQEEPVRRRMALKIIKPGMDTRQVLARFEAERQALAMMDHPNIARVFDAGATASGRPYFVMELVRGVRITDYCDANKLSMRDRLQLFVQVCQAVQHAHQKGIIHRDLKPSNILVTEVDGAPVPKVIDFGVAKAMQGRLTEKTLFTELRQMVRTPAYMSPEQAGLGALDIDTRSDIYGLGVLLYELLTGQTPLAREELDKAGLDEMLKLIQQRDPLKPSTRLSALTRAQLTTIAAQRRAEAPKLNRLLCGDLDWIVMKSLEKDRRRRYETAGELAADLLRHLHNEPVSARPPSKLYRLQKAWRRNQTAFTAGALMVLILLAGTSISLWQAIRATRAEASARQRLAQLEAVAQSFSEMSQHVRKVGEVKELPLLVYDDAGGAAIDLMKRMLSFSQEVHGPAAPQTIKAMEQLAYSYAEANRDAEAAQVREQVLALRRKTSKPADPEMHRARVTLAYSYCLAGRIKEATALLAEDCQITPEDTANSLTLAVWQAWFGQEAAYEVTRRGLLKRAEQVSDGPKTLERAAKAYCLQPASDAAELAKALALAQRAAALAKSNDPWRPWYEMALGMAEYRNGQYAAAERTLNAAEHALPTARHDVLGVARLFRVMSLLRQNRSEEAQSLFRAAVAQMPPFPADERRPYTGRSDSSHEALVCWLAYKEARSLLKP